MLAAGLSTDLPLIGPVLRWQAHLGVLAWRWVQTHGAIAMFVLLFTSGAGLPLPEDVPIIAAGVAIARHTMTWAVAAPVAWLAMMLGDTSLYVVGYIFGYRVVHLPMIGRHISLERIQRCQRWFDRWGIWVVGIGRMFAGIRTAIVITAGTMRFNYPKLLFADGIAAIVSGGAFMILGYWAGQHAKDVWNLVDQYRPYFSGGSLIIALILFGFLRWRSYRKAAARAAALKLAEVSQVAPPAKPM